MKCLSNILTSKISCLSLSLVLSRIVRTTNLASKPGKEAPPGNDYLLYSVKPWLTDLWAISWKLLCFVMVSKNRLTSGETYFPGFVFLSRKCVTIKSTNHAIRASSQHDFLPFSSISILVNRESTFYTNKHLLISLSVYQLNYVMWSKLSCIFCDKNTHKNSCSHLYLKLLSKP